MRILIGLREVAGYYSGLHQGFRALGVDSTFIDLRGHPFGYGGSAEWWTVRLSRACTQRYQKARLMKPLWGAAQLFFNGLVLLRALFLFDVFVFAFGASFLLLYDLPLLKLFNKKIIFVFLGTDVRPPYLNGASIGAVDDAAVRRCIRQTRRVKRRVENIEHYADAIISLPTFGLFQRKPFVHHAMIGFPSAAAAHHTPDSAFKRAGVRILHSPSTPILKGTPQIEQAIERLRARGYAIEWVTITGQPNDVVLRELAQCDFVVDQLYSDWLMPGFSTEAAFAGKPTIIGGYDLAALQATLPDEYVPPVHLCHPDDIEAAIEKLILDEAYRLDLGQRAKAFVEANGRPEKVAERLLRVIEGAFPDDWLCYPDQLRYFHGATVAKERLLPFLGAYIRQGGTEALQLADQPEQEAAFLEFAK